MSDTTSHPAADGPFTPGTAGPGRGWPHVRRRAVRRLLVAAVAAGTLLALAVASRSWQYVAVAAFPGEVGVILAIREGRLIGVTWPRLAFGDGRRLWTRAEPEGGANSLGGWRSSGLLGDVEADLERTQGAPLKGAGFLLGRLRGVPGVGVAAVPLWAPAALAGTVTAWRVVTLVRLTRRHRRRHACDGCGYLLLGLAQQGTCPECGRPFNRPASLLHLP